MAWYTIYHVHFDHMAYVYYIPMFTLALWLMCPVYHIHFGPMAYVYRFSNNVWPYGLCVLYINTVYQKMFTLVLWLIYSVYQTMFILVL